MKKYQKLRPLIFALLTGLTCWSCIHETKNTSTESHTSENIAAEEELPFEQTPIWEYDYGADTLVRIDSTIIEVTAKDAIHVLNKMYKDKISLDFVGQNEDTLFVKIDSATVLTQQMGSAGARAYMAIATFTLTEPHDIHVVSFDFKEGDHAYPGAYSRASFAKR